MLRRSSLHDQRSCFTGEGRTGAFFYDDRKDFWVRSFACLSRILTECVCGYGNHAAEPFLPRDGRSRGRLLPSFEQKKILQTLDFAAPSPSDDTTPLAQQELEEHGGFE